MYSIKNLNSKIFQTMENLEEKYIKEGKLTKAIFESSLDPRNPNYLVSTIISIITAIISEEKGIKSLNLLGLSCLIDVIKKTKETEGYAELEVFAQSIKDMRILQETYYDPQEKIDEYLDLQLSDQETSYFREFIIEALEELYKSIKEDIKNGSSINIQEAKIALLIANGLKINGSKIEEFSTLLTEKGITTEEFHPESLKILRILKYEDEALSSIKQNDVPLKDILPKLSTRILSPGLVEAIKLGDLEFAKILLDIEDIDLNIQDKDRNTALHYAADRRYLELVKMLLAKKNINPNQQNRDRKTPMQLVFLKENLGEEDLEIVEALLDKGAKLTNEDISKLKANPELIYKSAIYGHSQIIAVLLANGIDPDMQDENGNTLSQLVFLKENLGEEDLEIVEALLDKGAKLTDEDISKLKANPELIYKSAIYGHSQIIAVLLANGIDPDMQDQDGNTLLHLAAKIQDLTITKTLSEYCAEPKILERIILRYLAQNENLERINIDKIMTYLIENGRLETVEILSKKTTEFIQLLNKTKESIHYKRLPLDGVTITEFFDIPDTGKNLETAQILLANGADPNAKDEHGNTPLHLALRNGHLGIVKELIANGADLRIKGLDGFTTLHFAVLSPSDKCSEAINIVLDNIRRSIEKLIDPKIIVRSLLSDFINTPDNNGKTALHSAIENEKIESIEALLANGADPNIKDAEGNTALHLATKKLCFASKSQDFTTILADWCTKKNSEVNITKKLLEYGADPKIQNNCKETPLHLAALHSGYSEHCEIYKIKEVIEVLIAHDANLDSQDKEGNTPLHNAAANGELKIVELLLKRGADPMMKNNDGKTALECTSKECARDGQKVSIEELSEINTLINNATAEPVHQKKPTSCILL